MMLDWIVLAPGTLFMGGPINNDDEQLFVVSMDRDDDDPFLIQVEFETDDRVYWLGSDNKTYSCFKHDIMQMA